jgi:hypothetical protein
MSDSTVEQDASTTDGSEQAGSAGETEQQASGTTSTAGDDSKLPASQAELNRIIAERIKRVEAKYAGHADAVKKAAEFDKITEAQKSELQKVQERAEAAEKRAADLEAAEQKRVADAEAAKQIADWKADVSKKTGVPVEVLRGSDLAEIQAHAESLKALLPEPRKPGYVSGEGRTVAAGKGDPRQIFAEILKSS